MWEGLPEALLQNTTLSALHHWLMTSDMNVCQEAVEVLKLHLSESGTAELGESTFLSKPLAQIYPVAQFKSILFKSWMRVLLIIQIDR